VTDAKLTRCECLRLRCNGIEVCDVEQIALFLHGRVVLQMIDVVRPTPTAAPLPYEVSSEFTNAIPRSGTGNTPCTPTKLWNGGENDSLPT
jgi:hypothetical protein